MGKRGLNARSARSWLIRGARSTLRLHAHPSTPPHPCCPPHCPSSSSRLLLTLAHRMWPIRGCIPKPPSLLMCGRGCYHRMLPFSVKRCLHQMSRWVTFLEWAMTHRECSAAFRGVHVSLHGCRVACAREQPFILQARRERPSSSAARGGAASSNTKRSMVRSLNRQSAASEMAICGVGDVEEETRCTSQTRCTHHNASRLTTTRHDSSRLITLVTSHHDF